jgi:hypothetical protein
LSGQGRCVQLRIDGIVIHSRRSSIRGSGDGKMHSKSGGMADNKSLGVANENEKKRLAQSSEVLVFAQPLLHVVAVPFEPFSTRANRVQSLLQRLVERLGILLPEERFNRLRVRLGGEGRDGILDKYAQHPAVGCAQSASRSDNDEKKG